MKMKQFIPLNSEEPKFKINEAMDRKNLKSKDLYEEGTEAQEESERLNNSGFRRHYKTEHDLAVNDHENYGEELKNNETAPEIFSQTEEEEQDYQAFRAAMEREQRPVEFSEKELSDNHGRLEAAHIDPVKMEIEYQREPKNIIDQKESSKAQLKVENIIEERYEPQRESMKMDARKTEWYLPQTTRQKLNAYGHPKFTEAGNLISKAYPGKENLKTLPERKKQRMFRGLISKFLGK